MPMLSCYEGLHGLALGGPAHNNGRRTENGKEADERHVGGIEIVDKS